MPIFFGKHVRVQGGTPKELNPGGLDLLRASPDQIRVFAKPTSFSHRKTQILQHIPHVFAASHQSVTIPINHGVELSITPENSLPIALPPLCVNFARGIPAAFEQELNDFGFDRFTQRKSEFLLFSSLTITEFRRIVAANPAVDNYTPANAANVAAMKVAIVILRCLTVGAQVLGSIHQLEKTSPEEGILQPIPKKRQRTLDISDLTSTLPINKKPRTEPSQDANMITGDEDQVNLLLQQAQDDYDFENFGVLPAKMNAIEYNDGGNDEPGLLFPFVPALAEIDFTLIPRFFEMHFGEFLGETRKDQFAALDNLCAGWGILAKTQFGRSVTHLVKCMEIAIGCQANLHLMINNGLYQGAVIRGSQFRLYVHGRLVSPLSPSDLRKEISESNTHQVAFDAILAMCRLEDGETPELNTMRRLSDFIKKQALSSEERQTILNHVGSLNFNERFWGYSADFVVRALDLILNDDLIDDKIPMHSSRVFSNNRVELVLSAFGSKAPTFHVLGGIKIDLKTGAGAPTKNFVSRPVSLEIAIADYNRIASEKWLLNGATAISKTLNDKRYEKQDREAIWSRLLKLARSTPIVEGPTVGGGDMVSSGFASKSVFDL